MSREQLTDQQNMFEGGRPYPAAKPTTYGLPPELEARIKALAPDDEERLWALVEANLGWAQQIMSLAAHDMSGATIARVRNRWSVAHGRVTRGGGEIAFDSTGEVSLDKVSSDDSLATPASALTAAEAPATGTQDSVEEQGAEAQGASSSAAVTSPTRGHVTASRLNVRSTPDTKSRSNVLGGLDRGTEIEVLGTEGAWLKIMYRGQLAYVHGSYVAMSQPSADAVASASGTHDLDDV